jgi:hypothetical protein
VALGALPPLALLVHGNALQTRLIRPEAQIEVLDSGEGRCAIVVRRTPFSKFGSFRVEIPLKMPVGEASGLLTRDSASFPVEIGSSGKHQIQVLGVIRNGGAEPIRLGSGESLNILVRGSNSTSVDDVKLVPDRGRTILYSDLRENQRAGSLLRLAAMGIWGFLAALLTARFVFGSRGDSAAGVRNRGEDAERRVASERKLLTLCCLENEDALGWFNAKYQPVIDRVVDERLASQQEPTRNELKRWTIPYEIFCRARDLPALDRSLDESIERFTIEFCLLFLEPQNRQAVKSKLKAALSEILVSYCDQDRSWLDRLRKFLKPLEKNGKIRVWEIAAVRRWDRKGKLDYSLDSFVAAVLLVTHNYLASDTIARRELSPILDAAGRRGLTILWIAVSATTYDETELDRYECVNDPARPLDTLADGLVNQAMVEICGKIRQACACARPGVEEVRP